MEMELLKGLAGSGPWAILAGLLLSYVLRAWSKDREAIAEELPQLRSEIGALKGTVRELIVKLGVKEG